MEIDITILMQLLCHAHNVFGYKSPSTLQLPKALFCDIQWETLSRYNEPFLATQGFTSFTRLDLMIAAGNPLDL